MTPLKRRTIFAGCRELGLDQDTRRDLQLAATGKASMSDMTDADADKLIKALRDRGFKTASKGGRHRAASRSDLRYVHVLWGLLKKAEVLRNPTRDGLNAFVRSRFEAKWGAVPADIDMLRDAGQINDVTRALKDWCRREGIETEMGR